MTTLNSASMVYLGLHAVDKLIHGRTIIWPPKVGAHPTATYLAQGAVHLVWDQTENADEYQVHRNSVLVDMVGASTPGKPQEYLDYWYDWGVAYSYTITPVIDGVPGVASSPARITIPRPTAGPLAVNGRSMTSFTVSWPKVPGAHWYRVWVNGVRLVDTVQLSRTIEVSPDSSTTVQIEPSRYSVSGNKSELKTYYSGRMEVRDAGVITNIEFAPYRRDSWRPVDKWESMNGVSAQGMISSADGNYRGVIFYAVDGVRSQLRAHLGGGTTGVSRQLYGTCVKAELYLYRKAGIGNPKSVVTVIQRTNSPGFGDEPVGTNNVTLSTPPSGAGAWVDIGTSHGEALGFGDVSSLMTRADGFSNYAHFSDCRLRLSWSWNYVVTSARPNTWT